MTIYGILDANARRWWYHKELRKQGKIVEARRRERASIRDDVHEFREAIRNGGWVSIGRGGTTLHYAPGCCVQGCGMDTVECARILGIPILDSTTIPDRVAFAVLPLLPMAECGAQSREVYGPLDYCPVHVKAGMIAALGGTVENIACDPIDIYRLGQMRTAKQAAAYHAFVRGDAVEIGRALVEGLD